MESGCWTAGETRSRLESKAKGTTPASGHPWLRINRVLRVMLQTHWSAEAWSQVRVEFRKAVALVSKGF